MFALGCALTAEDVDVASATDAVVGVADGAERAVAESDITSSEDAVDASADGDIAAVLLVVVIDGDAILLAINIKVSAAGTLAIDVE